MRIDGIIGTVLLMAARVMGGASSYEWRTSEGQIEHRRPGKHWETTHISGASWFGFETQDFVVNGLWAHTMGWYLETLANLGVNVMRVPFSAEWIAFNPDLYPYDQMISSDPSLYNKTSLQILDDLFTKAAEKGIGILLDLHRLHKEYISPLWYSPTDNVYTSDVFFLSWDRILDHILNQKRFPNLVGIDLLNEPHDQATWGSGDYSTDWRLFVQGAVATLGERYEHHSFLFFVEGIQWGHTFRDWNDRDAPLTIADPYMKRVVFSPHTYGKSVVPSTTNDYQILVNNWETDFGFLRGLGHAVAVGEWGGITSLDADWMQNLVRYLMDRNMTNQFFWSLGPNSGDVQGILLDDWTTVDIFKQNVIQKLVPNPTRFDWGVGQSRE